ncbi:MAG: amino acid--tRNA ligase-related protein [Pseudomonadota bacterium]
MRSTLLNYPPPWNWQDSQWIKIRGRVVAARSSKFTTFFDLENIGYRLQVVLEKEKQALMPILGSLVCVQGLCRRSRLGEPSVWASGIEVIAPWSAPEPYRSYERSGIWDEITVAARPNAYHKLYAEAVAIQAARGVLEGQGFLPVSTNALISKYNGGISAPMQASFMGHQIGFLRTTLEERMKAALVTGAERVYQAGPVFRGGNEFVLWEGYAAWMSQGEGEKLIRRLLGAVAAAVGRSPTASAVAADLWEEIDFCETVRDRFGNNAVRRLDREQIQDLVVDLGVVKRRPYSAETAADKLGKYLVRMRPGPVLLRGYPLCSSPLYRPMLSNEDFLERTKGFLNGNAVYDGGLEENDVEAVRTRIARQRSPHMLARRATEPDIVAVLKLGLPPAYGFGVNMNRVFDLLYEES